MGKINDFLENNKIANNITKYFFLVIVIFLCYLLYKSNPTSWQLIILLSIIIAIGFDYDLRLRYGNYLSMIFSKRKRRKKIKK